MHTTSMQMLIDHVAVTLPEFPQLPLTFANALTNTFETTLRPQPDGSVFVITGDIPAMWLRDSAAQVKPYVRLARTDPQFADLIKGVVQRQAAYVLLDPYANAFNESANGRCHNRDKTEMSPWVWERKYELDSLCAPLELAYALWKATGDTRHLDPGFFQAAHTIINTIATEQNHQNSPYTFERLEGPPSDTLTHEGRGTPVGHTGMSWSGFRPSDDACMYHYLIPANMMAVVALTHLSELPGCATVLQTRALDLARSIRTGIESFGKVNHPEFGTLYAYETDGLGNHNLMDDANVPSLLAMPYLGYCSFDDPAYKATRAFVLSRHNPYFYQGTAAQGIGSPHTPGNYIWPIALCMQGLTSSSRNEQLTLLETLLSTTAGTNLMHESFDKDDPANFTRPWFAWANSLFAEFVLSLCDL